MIEIEESKIRDIIHLEFPLSISGNVPNENKFCHNIMRIELYDSYHYFSQNLNLRL